MSLNLNTKIFCDGADLQSMLDLANDDRIAGMTTNPSLMKKAGITDYKKFCHKVLAEIKHKPISFEVFADDIEEMRTQAHEIKTWGDNVYVKIPALNSEGQSTASLIKDLAHDGIKLNVTAVFTIEQTKEICAALKGGAPSILSIFAGRIADTGRDPMPIMREALEICNATDENIELLWASTRELFNIIQASDMKCPIITVPFDILKKLEMIDRDLMQMSIDTVKAFKKDSEAAGFSL